MTEVKPSKLKLFLSGLGAILVGLLLFFKSRNNTLEAQVENNEALKEKAEIDSEIAKNEAQLTLEEDLRTKKQLKDAPEDLTPVALVDFFNKRDKK